MNHTAMRVCLAIALLVAIAIGTHNFSAMAHAAPTISASGGALPFDDTSGNLTHTNTACAAAANHQKNFNSWVAVDCSTLPAGCLATTAGAANKDYDIDAMVDNNVDPPNICLRAANGDTVTWKSADSKNRTIMIEHLTATGTTNPAHPFKTNPPFNSGAAHYIQSPGVSTTGQPNACYKFDTFIQVTGPGGVQCWDPHIYTSCDSSCTTAVGKPKPKARPKKK
jgi:plastocyanin